MMYSKSELKKETLKRLDSVLKPQGYKREGGGGVDYYLSQDNLVISYILLFYSSGIVSFSGVYCRSREIEAYMRPLFDENYLGSQGTIGKTILPISFHTSNPQERITYNIDEGGLEGLDKFCAQCLDYINGEGADFVQHYSSLPNVFKRMDELTRQGISWQNRKEGILYGSLDAEFRGLIISKLCDDPKFAQKLEECDKVFSEEDYKEWLPYYEKLKAEVLPSIEPKYNV